MRDMISWGERGGVLAERSIYLESMNGAAVFECEHDDDVLEGGLERRLILCNYKNMVVRPKTVVLNLA